MSESCSETSPPKNPSDLGLLPKDRTILERDVMQFRPFGLDEQGHTIRDSSGMSIRASVVYLEKSVSAGRGPSAGNHAVEELCRLLNGRIKDRVYHVTPEFLKNPWNSYSYEFTAYLYEFCEQMSGDPHFAFRGGVGKVSPIMQALARPFSLAQIYGMFPYFGNKFASGSIECRAIDVTRGSATVAIRFSDRTLRQFGPYRRRCAHLVCQSAQGIVVAMPARVHGRPPAALTEISCMANDDDWCQWVVRWDETEGLGLGRKVWQVVAGRPTVSSLKGRSDSPRLRDPADTEVNGGREQHPALTHPVESKIQARRRMAWTLWGGLAGVALAAGVGVLNPSVSIGELVSIGLCPPLIAAVMINRRLRQGSEQREALIQEQITFVESRHEELREAYLEQEQMRVELRRKVAHLTALHRAGLLFSSTFDRDKLLEQVLEALTHELHYDRAMVSVFDPAQHVITHVRVTGVSPEAQVFAQSCRIPVTDRESPEGMVVLQGRPLLIRDMMSVWHELHPMNQQLAALCRTKALVAVPIKTKERVWGTLTVDRIHEQSLTEEDVDLMTTVANQVSIALDNALAYQQIEEWNMRLERKAKERTEALERADRLRAQFLSHVSHELRTPLTSIKGFIQNLLDGLTGPLNGKQQNYLTRMLDNSDRLVRMIEDLLDRTRIETGRLEVHPADVDLELCVADAVEQLRSLAHAKRQLLDTRYPGEKVVVWADRDRLIQAVVNLVQNAIKFTPEDGAITVAVELTGQHTAVVLVRDTGPGIPADCLEKIFDPFSRVQHGSRSGPKGLGLGLSIVKTLVELQGGAVTVSNLPEGGAEVSFTVPIRSAGKVLGPDVHMSGRRILVVDDDADIRQLLLDRLMANGYQPCVAIDGRQALEMVQPDEFGGVILDIGIGPLDGLDVLQEIRMRDRNIPIIMVTASGSQELAIKAIGMGAQAYLLKPFDAGELQQVMDDWFQRESPVVLGLAGEPEIA